MIPCGVIHDQDMAHRQRGMVFSKFFVSFLEKRTKPSCLHITGLHA